MDQSGFKSDFLARPYLATNIGKAGAVVAYQNGRQVRYFFTTFFHCRNFDGDFFFYFVGNFLSIKYDHVFKIFASKVESTPKSRANGIKLRYFLLGKNLRKPYL